MNLLKINKVLANQTRLDILKWLKNPEKNFPPHQDIKHFDFGVCVNNIRDKSGLSQSTISLYMSTMENVKLVILTRVGKWSYYKRNEETIANYLAEISKQLI
ncbi:hypothetical protein IMCC3317_00140 [Kordia antarctica]|uniref:HTH arsR-type domain-containing protein n=1 Tax=Kordia antarctica TaxID=1218801 RepID=A0A7L4ZDS7_9FLAO|nr:helix-turn-helix transcriptional regulator [Kordia antarctica]QHI34671.1 hypothetical protein IMCC3317_00140 [Kordia antarctica]